MFDNPNTPRTLANVTQVIEHLEWDADRVAVQMDSHNIRNRSQLAKTLGVGRATVGEAFDEQWGGRATAYLIAVMCSYFGVRMSDLVQEPIVQLRRMKSGHLKQIPNNRAAS